MAVFSQSLSHLVVKSIFFICYFLGPAAGLWAALYLPYVSLNSGFVLRLALILTPFFFWFAIILISHIPKKPFFAWGMLLYPFLFAAIQYFILSSAFSIFESIVSVACYFVGAVTLGYMIIVFVHPLYQSAKPRSQWKRTEWAEYLGVGALQLVFLVPAGVVWYMLARALSMKFVFTIDNNFVQVAYWVVFLWPLVAQTQSMIKKFRGYNETI